MSYTVAAETEVLKAAPLDALTESDAELKEQEAKKHAECCCD